MPGASGQTGSRTAGLLAFCVLLAAGAAAAWAQQAESQCVACHTNGRSLIKITREIARTRPAPATSVESTGEG